MQEGFEGASMSAIAARLGGSKGTLYNHFPNKEALFEACLRDQCGRFAETVLRLDETAPVIGTLATLGRRYLQMLCAPATIRTFQIIVAEADRSPELARVFYQAGPAVGLDRLAAWIRRQSELGALAVVDCDRAASQFLALCRGQCHMPLVLNQIEAPGAEAIAVEVDEAVATFMARYGVDEDRARRTPP